jgi:hypothetical protein
MLIIGNQGVTFQFTPSQLEANKDLVISALENIYNNVTAAKTKDINRSFEQITGISPEGGIESVTWPNYQSYLLSNKNPDGSTREDFELPIFTNMQPKEEGKFNRVGVYFYVTNTADEFVIPEPKAQAANIPIKQKTSFVLDGNTINTFTSPEGKKILFKASANTTMENYQETITVLPGADLAEVAKNIQDGGKDYKQVIKKTVYNAIAPQLTRGKAQDAFEMESTITGPVAPAQPVQQTSDVEVVSRYTNADVKANPNKIYVFGDNTERRGKGGQAQIRDNENAFGIATKFKPTTDNEAYFYDSVEEIGQQYIDADIAKIKADGRPVVFPKDGLGTGLAKLKEKAPKTYAYLKQRLLEEFGFDNDTGVVSKPTQPADVEMEMEVTIGTPAQQAEAQQKIDSLEDQINSALSDANSEDLRVKINEEIQMFEPENWTDVESWLKQNFPNVPVFRVKNIIQATNGRQAWGMFKYSVS